MDGSFAVDLALRAPEDGRSYDIVLTDIQMPVMDSHEAARALNGARQSDKSI